jgi:GNAT superfamily N-acetyltransferase
MSIPKEKLSSRPERTRISCHASLEKAACAPFCKGKAHEVHQRHQVPQEIRGSVVEGPAVFPLSEQCHTCAMLLRPAEPEDAIAVARVHVRSWQAAYRALLPADYLDNLRPEDRAQTYDFASRDPLKPQTIVASEDGLILGFATTMPSRESDLKDCGEFCALYVDPDHWNRGLGVALVSEARVNLFELGFRKAVLWILAGNIRAQRFYQIDRWAPDGVRKTDSIWGVTVDEVRYQRVLEAQGI